MKDIPKRPFSQCLSTIISPLFAEVRYPTDFWGEVRGEIGKLEQAEECASCSPKASWNPAPLG